MCTFSSYRGCTLIRIQYNIVLVLCVSPFVPLSFNESQQQIQCLCCMSLQHASKWTFQHCFFRFQYQLTARTRTLIIDIASWYTGSAFTSYFHHNHNNSTCYALISLYSIKFSLSVVALVNQRLKAPQMMTCMARFFEFSSGKIDFQQQQQSLIAALTIELATSVKEKKVRTYLNDAGK